MSNFWKKIEKPHYTSMIDCVRELKSKDYHVSPWIENIATGYKKKFSEINYPWILERVSVRDLGFDSSCKLGEIYKKVENSKLKLVEPLISILSRFYYDEQPNGEWLRFAVPFDSMVDTDGVPHLPKFGKALNKYFLDTYWSYSDAIFHPHNEFIFAKHE